MPSKSVKVVFGSGTIENWYKSALNSNESWIPSGIATIPKSLSLALGSDSKFSFENCPTWSDILPINIEPYCDWVGGVPPSPLAHAWAATNSS